MGEILCWRMIPGFELHWQEWDGEYIVYNSGSGDTHLLDPLSADLLKTLQNRPATTQQLAEGLIDTSYIQSDEPTNAVVARLLVEFDRLGLIESERIPS